MPPRYAGRAAIGLAEMPQHPEATRPSTSTTSSSPALVPARPLPVGIDPWDAMLSAEEDSTSVALADAPSESYDENDGDDAAHVDPQASRVAEVNAAAVEVAVTSAQIAYAQAAPRVAGGGAFTIPLLCAGIALIAACLLIPQSDSNRRLAYARVRLQADLEAVEKQVEVNDEFLRKVADDANLAERLAGRQMKIIREGNAVLSLKGDGGEDEMSPFQLTAVPNPTQLPPYQPRGGTLANVCYNPKSRLYLLGVGLLAIAGGLVLGIAPKSEDDLRL